MSLQNLRGLNGQQISNSRKAVCSADIATRNTGPRATAAAAVAEAGKITECSFSETVSCVRGLEASAKKKKSQMFLFQGRFHVFCVLRQKIKRCSCSESKTLAMRGCQGGHQHKKNKIKIRNGGFYSRCGPRQQKKIKMERSLKKKIKNCSAPFQKHMLSHFLGTVAFMSLLV